MCGQKNRPDKAATVKGESFRVAVPRTQQESLLALVHDRLAHVGVDKAVAALSGRFFWPHMVEAVREWVATCDHCQRERPLVGGVPSSVLGSIRPSRPFEYLGVDTLKVANRILLTAVDIFTKWGEAIVIPDESATTIASVLRRDIFSRFGWPSFLVSDRGAGFCSSLVGQLLSEGGTRARRTTAYHPRCNGATEKFNGTLLTLIRGSLASTSDFVQALSDALIAYRTTRHSATLMSPHAALFGHPFATQVAGQRPQWMLLRERLEACADRAKENRLDHSFPRYRRGDLVLVENTHQLSSHERKTVPRFVGPFKVTKAFDTHVVIWIPERARRDAVALARIKPYRSR